MGRRRQPLRSGPFRRHPCRRPRHPVTSPALRGAAAADRLHAETKSPRHRSRSAPGGARPGGARPAARLRPAPRGSRGLPSHHVPGRSGVRALHDPRLPRPPDLRPDALRRRLPPEPPHGAARRGDLGGWEGRVRRHRSPDPARLRAAVRVRQPVVPRRIRDRELPPSRGRARRAAPPLEVGPLARLQLPNGPPRRNGAEGDAARGLPGGDPALGVAYRGIPRRRERRPDPPLEPLAEPREDRGPRNAPRTRGRRRSHLRGREGQARRLRAGPPRRRTARRARARFSRHLPARPRAAGPRGARRRAAAHLHDDAVQPDAARRQTRDRPGAVAASLPPHVADPGPRRARDPFDVTRAHLLPAGPVRPERPALHVTQVPHDGGAGRGPPARDRPPERDDRAGVQVRARPAADAGRADPPAPVHRRAPAALERDRRRHEPRGPAPAAARGGLAVRALAAPPALDEPGPDVPVAGVGAERSRLRPVDGARSEVHRHLVADAGSEDPAENGAGGPVGTGRAVAVIPRSEATRNPWLSRERSRSLAEPALSGRPNLRGTQIPRSARDDEEGRRARDDTSPVIPRSEATRNLWLWRELEPGGLPVPRTVFLFRLLEQVLDRRLRDQEVGPALAVDLQAVLVVPLDPAADFLTVGQDDDHRRLRRHLLQVVVALRVGLLGRNLLALLEAARRVAVRELGEVRPDELAVTGDVVIGAVGPRRVAVRHCCLSRSPLRVGLFTVIEPESSLENSVP